jgi:branched-chain amino acid transport system substrate-binding protein
MKCKGILRVFTVLATVAALSGCTTPQETGPSTPVTPQDKPAQAAPVTVGLLLPLTDPTLGQKMLNAAQMALFDLEGKDMKLLPKDSGSSPASAAAAAQQAISEGANLIVGPVYADSVRSVGQVARAKNVPVIAFSTNTASAGNGVYLISILPGQQVEKILQYAGSRRRSNIAVITTPDAYGTLVANSAKSALNRLGLPDPAVTRITTATAGTAKFQLGAGKPDAVLLAVDGRTASTISARLTSEYGLPPAQTVRLGLGLWDEPSLAGNPNLQGAWFAAPDPGLRRSFERQYQELYGTPPVRLATQAYDAVALATVLSRRGIAPTQGAIQNTAGYSGLDGLFRFHGNGLSERGLAVLTFSNGAIQTLESAPSRF